MAGDLVSGDKTNEIVYLKFTRTKINSVLPQFLDKGDTIHNIRTE